MVGDGSSCKECDAGKIPSANKKYCAPICVGDEIEPGNDGVACACEFGVSPTNKKSCGVKCDNAEIAKGTQKKYGNYCCNRPAIKDRSKAKKVCREPYNILSLESAKYKGLMTAKFIDYIESLAYNIAVRDIECIDSKY